MSKPRTSIPKRCNQPATYLASNGYRACGLHSETGMDQYVLAEELGPCDYPLDGLDAMRYKNLNLVERI